MKLAKTLVALAAFASVSAIAQETETAALQPAEKESWVPSFTMSHSIVKGYYDRGILWDNNTGYEFSLDLNDLFVKNLRLSLFARLPIDKANQTDYIQDAMLDDDVMFNPHYVFKKIHGDDVRDDEFDYFGAELAYGYALQDVKFVGDISMNLTYRIQKNADIYSDYTVNTSSSQKYHGSLGSGYLGLEDLSFHERDNFKRRDRDEQQVMFGVSLDDVPIVTPNASIAINQDAKLSGQLGLKNTIPCTAISEKLTMNNSLDFYWFGKDYFKYVNKYKSNLSYAGVIYETGESQSAFPVGTNRDTIHSKAGFKNAVIRTSFDYAYSDSVNFSLYGMYIQQLHSLTEDDRWAYRNIHKSEFVYGVMVGFTF